MTLSAQLAERIAAHGPLTFAEFMQAALYDRDHGYYASGRAAIGRGGDYYTNVSVGSLFGHLLARQFAEMWERLGRPLDFMIVEQGAHRGDFAHDSLTGARALEPAFFAALRYSIVEESGVQRTAQQERLTEFKNKINWVDSLDALPGFTGVHFSNELIDAFPVHVVRCTGGEWRERLVDWHDDRFVWTDAPPTDLTLKAHLATLPRDLPDGYTTEVNLHAGPWLSSVAARLQRGWLLAIDYGFPRAEYYRRERIGGTLSAYANHRRIDDVLAAPGEADLTAHVDFTTLEEAAHHAELQPVGLADQHHFMVGLGQLHFPDTEELTPERQKEMRAFKTLMHPNLMGSSFKAIGFCRDVPPEPLSGFRFAKRPDGPTS